MTQIEEATKKMLDLGKIELRYNERKLVEKGQVREAIDSVRSRFNRYNRILWICGILAFLVFVIRILANDKITVDTVTVGVLPVICIWFITKQRGNVERKLKEAESMLEAGGESE